jgi:tRNA(Ile)-lysidine synthase
VQAADRAAGKTGPLVERELDALFQPLGGATLIALAVSGGVDSLALLDCVDRWRKRRRRPHVVVLTVDHRLRAGSRSDANLVKRIAEARGLKARVLVRKGPPPAGDVEAAARKARYRLLFDACRKEGASHLVVAHQRDDVAETFLMRLKRGAGIFGLAAMRPAIPVGDVTLVRPFLKVPRARLAATVARAGWSPVEDPMNADPRFARTAVRHLLASGELDPDLLAATAERFAALAATIDRTATAMIAQAVMADEAGVAWLDPKAFAAAPETVRARALVRLLIAVGGADYPPRAERLARLEAAILADAGGRRLKRTLGGVVFERKGERLAVYRETGRDGLPTTKVGPGYAGVFDGRFRVEIGRTARPGLTLGPLAADAAKVGRDRWPGVPAAAVAALPALRQRGKLLAFPGFAGEASVPVTFRALLDERLGRPPLFPEF